MSNAIFPASLIGYVYGNKKKPNFNTASHSPVSGRAVNLLLYDQPVHEFSLSNEWLSETDKNTFIGFFKARKGSFESFLFADEDSVITGQAIGLGDGVTTHYQLVRITNDSIEQVNNFAGISVYLDGVLQSYVMDYLINDTGLIIFTTAPTSGAVITWTGTAYYRCVFVEDRLESSQFANQLTACADIKFYGCMANKL
jgi:uncharacterized protein (TIGR02217 family)